MKRVQEEIADKESKSEIPLYWHSGMSGGQNEEAEERVLRQVRQTHYPHLAVQRKVLLLEVMERESESVRVWNGRNDQMSGIRSLPFPAAVHSRTRRGTRGG